VKQKDNGIFISQDKYVADILKKFEFATVKTASTLIETNKAFQVTPKVSHLHVVKRIFRYLKGQPKLGLWYPRDSPFDLEAFSDSDYVRASLKRKSTTGAEYVNAANCCGQVLWIQNQMLDYGFNFMNTKIHIDNESTICIVKNSVFHSKTKHIEIRHHFIKDTYKKKLVQVIKIHTDHNVADLLTKAFDVSRLDERKCNIQQKWMKGQDNPLIPNTHLHLLNYLMKNQSLFYNHIYKELEDRMKRAATTASSLEAEQDNGNINRTQSMAILNESFPQGSDSDSGPKCQDTIVGGVEA
ncbi:hypothetical protein Tco_1549707, partial [Tanacetum coccineum]